jgi:acyl carrier protein
VESILRSVLAIGDEQQVDASASFVDLGVDSLLAAELVSSVNCALGVSLSVLDVHANDTLRKLTAYVGSLLLSSFSGL